MGSIRQDVKVTVVNLQPPTVSAAKILVVSVKAIEVSKTWSDYENVTWDSLSNLTW